MAWKGVEDALDLNWSVLAQQVPVEAHEHREPGEHISGKSRKDVPIEFVELLDAVEGPAVLQGDLNIRNTNRAAENVRVPEDPRHTRSVSRRGATARRRQ
jgi:hypothetical protein